MASAKVMARPPNFGGENPQKSQKDEHRNGTNFFYQNLTKRAPIATSYNIQQAKATWGFVYHKVQVLRTGIRALC
jgi:hypothetical protein